MTVDLAPLDAQCAQRIEHEHGGWNAVGRESPAFDPTAPKATAWKGPCHEGTAPMVAAAACDG